MDALHEVGIGESMGFVGQKPDLRLSSLRGRLSAEVRDDGPGHTLDERLLCC